MASITLNKPSGGQLTLEPEDGTSTETVTIPSVGVGKVLQVVNAEYHTWTEFGSGTQASWNITGLEATITPTASSSKILVMFNVGGIEARLGNYHQEPDLRLTRNGTEVSFYSNVISQGGTNFWIPGVGGMASVSNTKLDFPNTTSSLTYRMEIRGNTNTSGDMRVGINHSSYASGNSGGGSSITLMEVAA